MFLETFAISRRSFFPILSTMARTRRSASNLGADIRGDTSAPAMSTMNEVSPIETEAPKWDKVRRGTAHSREREREREGKRNGLV